MSMSSSFNLEDEDISVLESLSSENDEEIVRKINHFKDVNSEIANVEPESMLADLEEISSNASEDIEVEREMGEVEGLGDSFETTSDHHDIEEASHYSPLEISHEEWNTDNNEIELSQDERDR